MRRRLVAALLVREDRALLCHRSPSRAWFPDAWDVPGGHVEAEESAAAALVRELREELGVEIEPPTGSPVRRVVTDAFELTVWRVDTWVGEVRNAASSEHDSIGWFSQAQVDALSFVDDRLPSMVADLLGAPPKVRIHLAGLLACPEVQALRLRWDPVMAALVPPHVTVAYPEEVPDVDLLVRRTTALAQETAPMAIRLTSVVADDEGRGGVFVAVDDSQRGWAGLRLGLLRPPFRGSGYPPHVTLVHPRTSKSGPAAYRALRGTRMDLPVVIDEIALTETGPDHFRVLQTFPLRHHGHLGTS
ncbi:ADP-ribose pyrophosphatase YjhB, NUDIX family [Allokutzneria albata]|uniref:8-oxo-dGTP diphosphatase n=1 Tax=Allokutzneria albata TaxID=211114 RepID=A0A1G9SNL1_ALLAB|nr:ADP-ribose pyrophosphatase YjhB, NUDIX family [Allokutzneria albata]